MPSRPVLTVVAIAGLVGAILSGCGTMTPPVESTQITIGSHDSLGTEVIAQVYGQYLAVNGYEVRYNPGVGDREDYLAGLRSGLVDLVPDFTVELLYALDEGSEAALPYDVDAALTLSLSQIELRVLDAAPAQRSDGLVVTRDFAETNSLTSIADLAALPEPVTIAAEPGWEERSYVREGLDDSYDLTDWTTLSPAEISEAALAADLVEGRAQAAVLPVTSRAIARFDLVVLDDPLGLFPVQNLITVVRADSRSIRLAELVDSVSAELTTEVVDGLMDKAARASSTPARIASTWLRSRGLLE